MTKAMPPEALCGTRYGVPKIRYLDPGTIIAAKTMPASPWAGRNSQGYGRKIPNPTMIQLVGGRWHRVYTCIFSNIGTCYVVVRGEWQVIGPMAENEINRRVKS